MRQKRGPLTTWVIHTYKNVPKIFISTLQSNKKNQPGFKVVMHSITGYR